MYNSFLYRVVKFYTWSCFTWNAMRHDSQSPRQYVIWMNVALRANFERFVEKLNLNQFQKYEVYTREYIFLS